MINKRGFKKIYEGDIVEVLQGEFIGSRYYVRDDIDEDGVNVILYGEYYRYFRHGEYFLWRSPLRNKLKRIKDRLWKDFFYQEL